MLDDLPQGVCGVQMELPNLLAQLRNTAHINTAGRLEFKSCFQTLGLGFLFGLGQSFVRLEIFGD